MDFSLFMQGIIIGLTLAAPAGPISLLCIQRTISDGRLHGIFSGIGVAAADSCYAAITFLGLTAVSGLLIANQSLTRLIAGMGLVIVGLWVGISMPAGLSSKTEHESYLRDFVSMFAITIANPLTILFFAALMPGFGVVVHGATVLSAAEFIGGVFFGSTIWWIVLCGSIGSVRSRLSPGNLRLINWISGVMIICFGAALLIDLYIFPGAIF